MASSSSYNCPCAACKFLRRKCLPGCIFAPYFPPEEPQKFANVHKIFGASNVTKLLNELLPHQREDAVNSLAYEAEARVRDPVYGCVGAISFLQRQVQRLQKELDSANADLFRYACNDIPTPSLSVPPPMTPSIHPQRSFNARFGNEGSGGGGFIGLLLITISHFLILLFLGMIPLLRISTREVAEEETEVICEL